MRAHHVYRYMYKARVNNLIVLVKSTNHSRLNTKPHYSLSITEYIVSSVANQRMVFVIECY